VLWRCWLGGRKGIRPVKSGGWWRWALFSLDGVAPSWMVGASASVNLPLHHKFQKFSSGTSSPGWSGKRAVKRFWCGGGGGGGVMISYNLWRVIVVRHGSCSLCGVCFVRYVFLFDKVLLMCKARVIELACLHCDWFCVDVVCLLLTKIYLSHCTFINVTD